MASNDFLAFGGGGAANVIDQATYAALAARLTGFQSGTAQSAQLNKVWRQSSIMSAVLAQFIVDLTGRDAIDDGTTASLLANLKAAVQAQSAAVVGQARNVAMSVTTASTSATLNADEIVVGTALAGQKYMLGAFSKTINLATTGAGGMDTGSAPASGYVALYAIYNPTTGASALLATNATSAVAPSAYGGANMPTGYTASALVSVWPTNGSGQFVTGYQRDRTFYCGARTAFTVTAGTGSYTSISVSGSVPQNAKRIFGSVSANSNTSQSLGLNIAGDSSGAGFSGVGANGVSCAGSYVSPIITPQAIYYLATGSSGTLSFVCNITSYEI
ncbi:TPA: hypothetical protein QDB00_005326 [Burkholderia vietnamiensis]|nr:hypothetical protein [Burkholderia vietnamiensis]